MKFRRRARSEVTVELVPLVDVVLVLLLFFMVSTTFVRQSELKVELPEADAKTPQQMDNSVIEVAIGADGEYAVNGRLLVDNKLQTLMRALREAVDGDLNKRLVINADSDARHQSVVRAMDAAGQLGLVHLRITTRTPDAG
jgi:biopolymer transport protein ExbD